MTSPKDGSFDREASSSSISDKEIETGGSTAFLTSPSALQGPLLLKPTVKSFTQKTTDKVKATFTKKGLKNLVQHVLPITEWLPNYDWWNCLRGDLTAGFTVGVILVPQSMAYAIVAGLPPIYGLYTALLPIFVYACLGTSRQLSVGPVAVVSLLISESVGAIVDKADTENYVRIAGSLALMSGVINALCGVLQLGFLVSLLSPAVVTGFTSASAIVIICSQLKDFFGVTIPSSATTDKFYQALYWLFKTIGTTNYVAFLICFFSLIALLGLQKWKPIFPWALIILIIDTVISYLVVKYGHFTLKIVKAVPEGLPHARLNALSMDEFVSLIPTAIIIAFVGFMESISISRKYAQMAKFDLRPSQEFFALGVANVIGSFFGSYPATGSFSRTAVKFKTGSTSQVSAFFAGLVVLFSLLFLTPLFYYIPKASLAAIIIVAVLGLIDYQKAIDYWKTSVEDFLTFVVTFCFVLGLGADLGIAIGIGFSLLVILYKSSRPHTAQLGNVGGKVVPNYRNIKRHSNYKLEDHTVIARIDSFLYFANVSYVEQKLYKYLAKNQAKKPIKFYIIEFTAIQDVDAAGLQMLRNFKENMDQEGVTIIIAGVRGVVSDTFVKAGFHAEIGEENFLYTVSEAVEHAHKLHRLQLIEEEKKRKEDELNPKKPEPLSDKEAFFLKVRSFLGREKKNNLEKEMEEQGGKLEKEEKVEKVEKEENEAKPEVKAEDKSEVKPEVKPEEKAEDKEDEKVELQV